MIKVLHPGLHSSLQDSGRFGVAKYAIPHSGVMDSYSASFANLLLQNEKDATVLEITLQGPKLEFESKARLVCSGLKAKILLNEKYISLNEVFQVEQGDVLHIQQVMEGNYLYLACQGGFKSESVLGSSSFYSGITQQVKLKKGNCLQLNSDASTAAKVSTDTHSHLKFQKEFFNNPKIEVFEGPEFHQLNSQQQEQLLNQVFHLSKNYNRMAFQLEETLENELNSILTSPVIPGTVQLTPDGKLIVLMKDAQTTGGYPRVLQLTKKGIFQLAQKRQNTEIQFQKKLID